MTRKTNIILLAATLLITVYWFALREAISDNCVAPTVRKSSTLESDHQSDQVSSPGQSVNTKTASSNSIPEDSHRNFNPPLDALRSELRISGKELQDSKSRLRQQEAIRKLSQLRRPDAVALIIEVLLDPQQQYLAKAVTSTGTPYTSSYELMEGLNDCLEGLPEPLNTIYSDEDVPRFASWWQKNKSALRFKAAVGHK